MLSIFARILVFAFFFCINGHKLYSQGHFVIDGIRYNTDTEIHTFQYRFYIQTNGNIIVNYPYEIKKFINKSKNVSKEITYQGIEDHQIEFLTTVSFKNVSNQDSLYLETVNDTCIVYRKTLNYDSKHRLVKLVNYYFDTFTQNYSTSITRKEYTDTLINDTSLTFVNSFITEDSLGEYLNYIEKITYDSKGREQFTELIFPIQTEKHVVENLYDGNDNVIGSRSYVNNEVVYSSLTDTLPKDRYMEICTAEYCQDIKSFKNKSELEDILIETLTQHMDVLQKPNNCEEKHITFCSSNLNQRIIIEWAGPDFIRKKIIKYIETQNIK